MSDFTAQEEALYNLLVQGNPDTKTALQMSGISSTTMIKATLDDMEFTMVIGVDSENDISEEEGIELIWAPLFIIPSDEMMERLQIKGALSPVMPYDEKEA